MKRFWLASKCFRFGAWTERFPCKRLSCTSTVLELINRSLGSVPVKLFSQELKTLRCFCALTKSFEILPVNLFPPRLRYLSDGNNESSSGSFPFNPTATNRKDSEKVVPGGCQPIHVPSEILDTAPCPSHPIPPQSHSDVPLSQ